MMLSSNHAICSTAICLGFLIIPNLWIDVLLQFMGDIVNAMKDYQAAIKKDPSYSLAYFNAANLYLGHRQFQQVLFLL